MSTSYDVIRHVQLWTAWLCKQVGVQMSRRGPTHISLGKLVFAEAPFMVRAAMSWAAAASWVLPKPPTCSCLVCPANQSCALNLHHPKPLHYSPCCVWLQLHLHMEAETGRQERKGTERPGQRESSGLAAYYSMDYVKPSDCSD